MRKICFVANWKMNKTIAEADPYLLTVEKRLRETSLLSDAGAGWEGILAPPFTFLAHIDEFLKGVSLKMGLAGQNVSHEEKGPYTGEISPIMLYEVGCRYVIIGHSERRIHFGETGGRIHKKVMNGVKTGLSPILCVGERWEERGEGKSWEVIERQLQEAFGSDFPKEKRSAVMIAYEPVWAIGTGQTPLPSEAEAVHSRIRDYFRSEWGAAADGIRLLYGGSVTAENIEGFMREPDIDGALVGGASLSAEGFSEIIKLGVKAKNN